MGITVGDMLYNCLSGNEVFVKIFNYDSMEYISEKLTKGKAYHDYKDYIVEDYNIEYEDGLIILTLNVYE